MRHLLEFVTEAVSKGRPKKYADVLFVQSEFEDALERSKNTVPMAQTTFDRVVEMMTRNAYPQMRSVVSNTSRPQYYVTNYAIYITNITFIYVFQYYEGRLLSCSRKPLDGTYVFNDIYLNIHDFRSSGKSYRENANAILRDVQMMLTGEDPVEVSEAVTNRKKRYLPEFGCSTQDIVDWIEESGGGEIEVLKWPITSTIRFDSDLKCFVGPCSAGGPRTYWVELANRFGQRVIMKPKIQESFACIDGKEHLLSFDQAVGKALEMIQNPSVKIKL